MLPSGPVHSRVRRQYSHWCSPLSFSFSFPFSVSVSVERKYLPTELARRACQQSVSVEKSRPLLQRLWSAGRKRQGVVWAAENGLRRRIELGPAELCLGAFRASRRLPFGQSSFRATLCSRDKGRLFYRIVSLVQHALLQLLGIDCRGTSARSPAGRLFRARDEEQEMANGAPIQRQNGRLVALRFSSSSSISSSNSSLAAGACLSLSLSLGWRKSSHFCTAAPQAASGHSSPAKGERPELAGRTLNSFALLEFPEACRWTTCGSLGSSSCAPLPTAPELRMPSAVAAVQLFLLGPQLVLRYRKASKEASQTDCKAFN